MSLSFGSSSKTTKENKDVNRDPWDETIPYLKDFLKTAGGVGNIGESAGQTAAFDQLSQQAGQGNPWASQQGGVANTLYGTQDRTGMVGDAYSTLQGQLGDYASGKYLDPMSNPQIQAMMSQVGDDIANRTNAQFAGAGRSLSGANQMATARGVSQGTLGLLLDQYNRAQGNQISAANALYGAGANTATTQGALDAQRAGLLSQGAGAAQSALDMQRQGATDTLNIEQQRKELPYKDLQQYASLLFPAAGLGGQENSKGISKTKGSSLGGSVDLLKAAGTVSSLSDERAKDDIEEVGRMADGTPIFRYRYKDDPSGEIHMGPMAQDVEKTTPEAVYDDVRPDGMKMVDMDAATRKAAEIVRQRRGGR